MALKFRDGWGTYAVHGVTVPENVILHPDKITLEEINKEQNAEVRRVMWEKYGFRRYLKDTCARLVDADLESPQQGAAPRALMQLKTGEKYLVVTDGSTGRSYYLLVPGNVSTCRQAHEALCGFDETRILVKS
jgi:hypothetical protein